MLESTFSPAEHDFSKVRAYLKATLAKSVTAASPILYELHNILLPVSGQLLISSPVVFVDGVEKSEVWPKVQKLLEDYNYPAEFARDALFHYYDVYILSDISLPNKGPGL